MFPLVVGRGGLYGVATDDYWIDAGRPELYLAANLDLLGDTRVHDRCEAIEPGALVEPSATVRNSIVSAGAHIDANASVIDSVVLPGARIGAGSLVESSLVMGDVGSNAKVVNGMVGTHGAVADGGELRDAGVPDSPPE